MGTPLHDVNLSRRGGPLLSIDFSFPPTVTAYANVDRSESGSFASALRSLADESVIFVSFIDCTYVDLAVLSALVSHDASRAAPLIVIVPTAGYVRSQFALSGLDCRLGVVESFERAYERARRLRSLEDIGDRAMRRMPLG